MNFSYVTELYSLLGSHIQRVNTNLEDVANCVGALDCIRSGTARIDMIQPAYAMHKCVGTAALVASYIIEEAFICLCTWRLVETKPVGVLLIALFIGTCSTAIMHIKNACWADPVVTTFGKHPLVGAWSVSDVVNSEVTLTLVLITMRLSAAKVIRWLWKNWRRVESFVMGGADSGGKGSRLLLAYSLSLVLTPIAFGPHIYRWKLRLNPCGHPVVGI
ncbi:hypothetical protein C8Q74DRAFT_804940 [Fomes fomentarius]|nr:hypothetical protein C8Q74DRAFT_804940 [Fomes fomentarius]